MRILFTFVGGSGHYEPLLPLARAAVSARHDVAFSGRPGMMPLVEQDGFAAIPSGGEGGDSTDKYPLLEVDMQREEQALREHFAGRMARSRSAALLEVCAAWQPDVLVCDEIDFGGLIAAECLGLPYTSVLVIASGSFVRPDVVAAALDEVRAEHGLAPDPTLAALSRYLVLSPFPPGFRDPAHPLPATAHSLRPPAAERIAAKPALEWLSAMPHPRTVYFTLGTIFNRESGDLFTRVLAGLRDLPEQCAYSWPPFRPRRVGSAARPYSH
ncbi:MAG: hypothetical protein R3E39_17630 [Anaerolineae bacterium]